MLEFRQVERGKKHIMTESIDIQPLVRMKDLLKKALTRVVRDELDEMAAVQVFEVSYELV